jgi:trans-2,3-dihydro-3-hydroxyanthranilate isomerase
MQKIAREINLSETAFVMTTISETMRSEALKGSQGSEVEGKNSSIVSLKARYFTPQEELPFAGHPTLSVAHVFWQKHSEYPMNKIEIELPAGVVGVERTVKNVNSFYSMTQLAPRFLKKYDKKAIAQIYGIEESDFIEEVPVQTVSTGTPVLMIALKKQKTLEKIHYKNASLYFELKKEGDFMYPHHFCLEGITSSAQTFARSLGTPPDGLEDPFTGSSTGCMAAFLWRYGLIKNPQFIAQQGHWMGRPGEAHVEVLGAPENIHGVRVSGGVVSLIEGRLSL